WHFQETPGETWDYTATQHIMMAELNIEGTERKVLMHAPKNGFFYVIDRTNGKFISGKPFVPVTWAEGLDKDGRPIETAEARYPDPNKPVLTFPSPFGAHNWHPMSYSPNTGLVYFSAQEMPFAYKQDKGFEFKQGEWNLGVQFSVSSLPEDPREAAKIIPLLKGRLLAWDPIKQEKAWSVEHAGPWNGGTLATAGGLVFQGTPGGEFAAYHDETGEKLWSTQVDTGVVAAPMTYMVDGEQYVAVSVGWGTVFGLIVPGEQRSRSRVLVFKVGGTEKLGEHPVVADRRHQWPKREEMPEAAGTPTQVAAGKEIYLSRCVWCHGDASLSAGVLPDLRMLDKAKHANFENVVYEGIYAEKGMPAFKELLSKEDVEAVRQYIVKRAHDTRPADM
ncbi:MAG: c-type cytochrome, partial [Myxococcota bacterium]